MIEKFISFVEVYSFVGCNALKKHESSKNKRKERKDRELYSQCETYISKESEYLVQFRRNIF